MGGVTFNFLSAIIFSFILLVSFGYDIPKVQDASLNQQYVYEYNQTVPDEEKIESLQNGDVIRAINGTKVSFITGNTYASLIKKYNVGDKFEITVQRTGEKDYVTITTTKFDDGKTEGGVLGVMSKAYRYNFWEALRDCVPLTCAFAWKVLVFLFMLITGGVALTDVGGPITTIGVVAEYSQMNIANLFVFVPLIAANLAVFNILPIPALDGSRVMFTIIEWIRKKPINRKVEGYIHLVGLCVLFAFVIFVDIFNLIW